MTTVTVTIPILGDSVQRVICRMSLIATLNLTYVVSGTQLMVGAIHVLPLIVGRAAIVRKWLLSRQQEELVLLLEIISTAVARQCSLRVNATLTPTTGVSGKTTMGMEGTLDVRQILTVVIQGTYATVEPARLMAIVIQILIVILRTYATAEPAGLITRPLRILLVTLTYSHRVLEPWIQKMAICPDIICKITPISLQTAKISVITNLVATM